MTLTEKKLMESVLQIYAMYCNSKSYYGQEFESLKEAVDIWIDSQFCGAQANGHEVPFAVKRAVIVKFRNDLSTGLLKLRELQAYGGYYGFSYAGMFHGVEPDGYIHT